jgi:hypothetical protein
MSSPGIQCKEKRQQKINEFVTKNGGLGIGNYSLHGTHNLGVASCSSWMKTKLNVVHMEG